MLLKDVRKQSHLPPESQAAWGRSPAKAEEEDWVKQGDQCVLGRQQDFAGRNWEGSAMRAQPADDDCDGSGIRQHADFETHTSRKVTDAAAGPAAAAARSAAPFVKAASEADQGSAG